MKNINKTLPLAFLLVLGARAQDDTDTDAATYGSSTDDMVTSYYTVCPDSTTPSSETTDSATVDPNQLTRTGDDGRTTIYRTETTILPHMCPGGDGVCGATYTLSSDCPCTAAPKTVWEEGECPDGFTTSAAECTVCASNGGPATVTVTVPMDNGPYATVTPKYGSPVNNPTDICTDNTPASTGVPDNNAADTGSANTTAVPAGTATYGSNGGGSSSNSGNRYGNSASNSTKPYTYKPYTGAAGRINIGIEGVLSIVGAGLVGALAIFL